MKRVLVCIPKCGEKAKDFDSFFEMETFINIDEISKDPLSYLKETLAILKNVEEKNQEEIKKLLYKLVNNDFLNLILNEKDVELHICVKNKGVQSLFLDVILNVIKDLGDNSVIIEKDC